MPEVDDALARQEPLVKLVSNGTKESSAGAADPSASPASSADEGAYTQNEDVELEQSQQRLLLTLASSPFHIIQKDPALVGQCLSFAVEVAAGKRGDIDARSEHNQSTFQFLSRFITEILIPLSTTTTPATLHSGDKSTPGIRGNTSSNSGGFTAQNAESLHRALANAAGFKTGDATTTAAATAAATRSLNESRDVALSRINSVSTLFLLHPRWHLDLASQGGHVGDGAGMHILKLALLKLLLQEGNEEGVWLSKKALLLPSFVQPLLHSVLAIDGAGGAGQGQEQGRYFSSLLPRTSAAVRGLSLEVASVLLGLLRELFFSTQPYKLRRVVALAPLATGLPEEGEKEEEQAVSRQQLRVLLQPTISLCVSLLDDPTKGIRRAATQMLGILAPFVSADEEEGLQEVSPPPPPAAASAGAAGAAGVEVKVPVAIVSDEDSDEEEEGKSSLLEGTAGACARVLDAAPMPLPVGTLGGVTAALLREVASILAQPEGQGQGHGEDEDEEVQGIAETLRSLAVLDPVVVQAVLARLEGGAVGEAREGEKGDTFLCHGVLLTRVPPLTPSQRTYRDPPSPLQQVIRDLLDHCELLASLTRGK